MNSISIPTQNNRLLKPSEAFAILEKLQQVEAQQQTQQSTSQWFALVLEQANGSSNGVEPVDTVDHSTTTLGLLIQESCNKELLEAPSICQVPFTPAWLKGFITVRGQIAPVIDLPLFFDIDNDRHDAQQHPASMRRHGATGNNRYLLHFDDGSESFAICVSSLPRKFAVTSTQAMAQPPELTAAMKSCVGTCYQHQGIWCEWNIEQFKRRLTQMLSHT